MHGGRILGERERAHLVVQTASFHYIYIRSTIRRALNLLRASFFRIFQYFSAVNVTRVSFSPVFQYFVTYVCICHANCIVGHGLTLNSSAMDSSAIGVQCRCCCICR